MQIELLQVVLQSSTFKRYNVATKKDLGNFKNDIQIGIDPKIKGTHLNVHLSITINITTEDEKKVCDGEFEFVGLFRSEEGIKKKDLEIFGRINGAAIVYPFIREHIAGLTIKSLLPVVQLPVFNFVQEYENWKATVDTEGVDVGES